MSRPLRTNPVYAHLAYKKAIITRTIVFLRRTFLGDELTDPREVLICEEVFQQDQKVPQEEVQHHIESLTEESAQLDTELRKFELVSRTQQGQNDGKQKKQKDPRKQNQKGGQGDFQGGRRH